MRHFFRVVATAFALLSLAACSAPGRQVRNVLQAQGYTNIYLGGAALFGCSDDDDVSRKFVATGFGGTRVTGVVCGGWGPFSKGYTVRITTINPARGPGVE